MPRRNRDHEHALRVRHIHPIPRRTSCRMIQSIDTTPIATLAPSPLPSESAGTSTPMSFAAEHSTSPEVPAGRLVARRRAAFPDGGRAPLHEPGPGPHVREPVRARRALHQRQDARAQPRPLVRRSGRARSARALQRRGAQAPGAVPARRSRLPRASMPAGLRGDGATERRRAASCSASRPGPCSRSPATSRSSRRFTTRRASSRIRICPSFGRTCSSITGRRSRSTRSSTSSNGGARTRSSTTAERDAAVNDLIDLVAGVDGILQAQAKPTRDTSSASASGSSARSSNARSTPPC